MLHSELMKLAQQTFKMLYMGESHYSTNIIMNDLPLFFFFLPFEDGFQHIFQFQNVGGY
jgi:hypothetical protein